MLFKQRLIKIDEQKTTQRKNYERLTRATLMDYINAGKSTLMDLLSKNEVLAENKFLTMLDTTVRKVAIENLPFLLADMVGFIRKLPTDLADSFKSTLDEVCGVDLLLHVIGISHPDFKKQVRVIDDTLKKLDAVDKPATIVFNKIDQYR